jgi:hypothetical protein
MTAKFVISRPSFLLAGLCALATLGACAAPAHAILFSQHTLPFNGERF